VGIGLNEAIALMTADGGANWTNVPLPATVFDLLTVTCVSTIKCLAGGVAQPRSPFGGLIVGSANTPAESSTQVSVSPMSSTFGSVVSYSATVSDDEGTSPTGTVSLCAGRSSVHGDAVSRHRVLHGRERSRRR
jgi:hypothetical protein